MVATFSVGVTATPRVPSADLSVVITRSGTRTTYLQAGAQNMGDYVDPAGVFVQQCFRAARQDAALPGLTVWFRPDANSTRREVVVELGIAPTCGTVTPANLPAYTAEIYDCGVLQTTINVPVHYWYARWRWQSTPRPARTSAAALIASGCLPHYDPSVLGRFSTNLAPQTYSIMGLAGIYPSMGNTGERPDIGIITDWQANYVCNGSLLSTVLAQGEASGTIGMHVRDSTTGAPLNLVAYPNATTYPGGWTPLIKLTTGLVSYDSGHSPALSYLPALLTGDPYFIEALQFQANIEIMGEPPAYRYTKAGRYGAWALRNKAYAAVCSPDTPPSWLLPKTNFRQHMECVRQKMITDMANSDCIYSVFRCRSYGGSQGTPPHPANTYASLWQDSMETAIYSLLVQLGFTEWRPQAVWKVNSEIKRLEGMEWPRASPVPYQLQLQYTCSLAAACTATDTTIKVDSYGAAPWPAVPFQVTLQNEKVLVTNTSNYPNWTVQRGYAGSTAAAHVSGTVVVGQKFASWTEAAARAVALYSTEIPFMPGDTCGMNELYNATAGSACYPSYARGALAIAVRNGITEAASAFAWIDGQFAAHLRSNWAPAWKWMIT